MEDQMIPLTIIIGILLFINLITIANVLTAPMIKRGPMPVYTPLVSICIPVRNERDNIGRCLETMLFQDYPEFEILILDDHSTDDTLGVISKFQDSRIKIFQGDVLPNGWTGKNWACHQLSQQAKGEYLIFTDADNFYHPSAVSKTIGWMQKLNLSLISAFPQQLTESMAEKLVIPVIDMFVYSFLVLRFTFLLRFPSMAAANGQWLAFTQRGYELIGGHKGVKSHIVEDTELARKAKRKGERMMTTSGRGAVYGHMYHSWSEVWHGFSKNAFGLLGYRFTALTIFLILLCGSYIAPWFFLLCSEFKLAALAAIGLGVFQRMILALKFKQPVYTSTLLNPAGIVAVMAIALHSSIRYWMGSIQWKDRTVLFSKDNK